MTPTADALISILMKWNAPFALLILFIATTTIYKSTSSGGDGSSGSSGGGGSGENLGYYSGSSSGSQAACAACKYQRRKCTPECIFAPYFPADQPRKFRNAHRLFGVSNIMKILKKIPRELWDDAMTSIIYESDMRERFPDLGCVRVLSVLKEQLEASKNQIIYVKSLLEMVHSQPPGTYDGGMYNENDDVGLTSEPPDERAYHHNNYLMAMPPQMESVNVSHGGATDHYDYHRSRLPPENMNYDNGGFEGMPGSSSGGGFYRANSENMMGQVKLGNDDPRRYVNPPHLSKDKNKLYQEISQPHGDQADINYNQLDCGDMFLAEPNLGDERYSEEPCESSADSLMKDISKSHDTLKDELKIAAASFGLV